MDPEKDKKRERMRGKAMKGKAYELIFR